MIASQTLAANAIDAWPARFSKATAPRNDGKVWCLLS